MQTTELTLSEIDRQTALHRERAAMRERITGSIAAFEVSIPKIDAKIDAAKATVATLAQLSDVAATLPAGVEGTMTALLYRGSRSTQSVGDAREVLLDLLARTQASQQARLDLLVQEREKAVRKLASLREGLKEFSE